MKKTNQVAKKRLSLQRDVVRTLGPEALELALGGGELPTSCSRFSTRCGGSDQCTAPDDPGESVAA